jgi:Tol biopolymer transport system component
MDARSGERRIIAEDYEHGPAWSPDSQHIAYTAWRRDVNPSYLALMVVDIETGQQSQLTAEGHHDRQPAWSPDGRWIAVISDRDGHNAVYRVDAVSGVGERLAAVEGTPSILPPTWSPDGHWLAVVTTKYISNTSTVDLTYVVDVLNPANTHGAQRQMSFVWQP